MDMAEIEDIIKRVSEDEPYETQIKVKKIVLEVLKWEISHLDQEMPHFTKDYKKIFDRVAEL